MLFTLFADRRFFALALFRKRCYTIGNDINVSNGYENPGECESPGFSIPFRRLRPGLVVALHPLIEPLTNVMCDYTCRN